MRILMNGIVNTILEKTSGNYECSIRLLVACLDPVIEHLPDEGLDAVAVAKEYWLKDNSNAAGIGVSTS